MMGLAMMRTPWPLALSLLGAATIASLAGPPRRALKDPERRPLLPRPELLGVLGNGYRHVLADYFWLQSSYAVGSARACPEYLDAYHFTDLVTELDPRFEYAYLFAGAALPCNLGRETWVNTAESTRLLEKGVAAFPDNLQLRIALAYNLGYYHQQWRRAAEVLERASRHPKAPKYLASLATRLYSQAGDIDAGLALAASLLESAPDEPTREALEHRIKLLLLERELRRVDAAIKTYEHRHGSQPSSVAALIAADDLAGAPSDPLGGEVFIGTDGRAHSTAEAQRLEWKSIMKE